jgi:hypothetical protein
MNEIGDTLLAAAYLRMKLGEELFNVVLNPDNTKKVKEFAETLVKLPTAMTVGGVTYEIIRLVKKGEDTIGGEVMVDRIREAKAMIDEDDYRNIKEHQDGIPVELRGFIVFIFTGLKRDRRLDDREVSCFRWNRYHWIRQWRRVFPDTNFGENIRALRRKS